jgi:hypothetical protein
MIFNFYLRSFESIDCSFDEIFTLQIEDILCASE